MVEQIVNISATVDLVKPERAPKEGKHVFSVQVKKGRSYILQAEDEEAKTAWLEVLQLARDNYGPVECTCLSDSP